MASQRVLAGVAHDIAHHAVSGVCYVHPHLHNACRSAGVLEASVDLLSAAPYPSGLAPVEPLRLSLAALHDQFLSILAANGFTVADVKSANLVFRFPTLGGDGYTCEAVSSILSSGGHQYSAAIETGA